MITSCCGVSISCWGSESINYIVYLSQAVSNLHGLNSRDHTNSDIPAWIDIKQILINVWLSMEKLDNI